MGSKISSKTEKITTSDDTMIGTIGRARMAAPVVMAAETPQIEIVASAAELIQFKPSGKDDLSGSGKSKQQQISAALESDE